MNINVLRSFEKTIFNLCNIYRFTCVRSSTNASIRHPKIEKENKSLTEDFVPNTILNKRIKTAHDWEDVRHKLLTSSKQISQKTIDSIILSVCISAKNYDLGFAYIDFLKQQKVNLGLATVGKYFKLFYLANCGNAAIRNEDEIYSLYKSMRAQFKVFDAVSCENIIHALSITRYWRECLQLLDEMRITCDPNRPTYSVIAAACFRNGAEDLGWQFLNECANSGNPPLSVAYLAYIDAYEHNEPLKRMEVLFSFFRQYEIECDIQVANRLIGLYQNLNLNAKHTSFYNSAKCKNCRTTLRKSELTESEFEALKDAIFKNIIVGSNVFYKSTPAELEQFKQFTANMKSYDVVIDGLNVAYTVGTKQSPHVLSFFVKSVVKHFVDQNKTVLLLGRTHMNTWPKSNWAYVTEHCDTFLTQSLSQDDPYLLYCALHCGVNTIIVSRDLMRGHVFKLADVKLKTSFNRWLVQNQYQLLYVNSQGKVNFKYPLPYTRSAQMSNGIWHLPLADDGGNSNMWMCLTSKAS
ncbi:mitochondrial ribonuclease P catalytic subunit [Photinus pyralis]|uniref:mitochondrial ribonuclease P catalytic subunit n=1 Tax=Photinus pyralis TaxID=7054 RepID=UPI0012677DF7|nr:mitochondrial ribonuclease P catalytic subunit [Photinus pyralis]